jgi:hypothetical protein
MVFHSPIGEAGSVADAGAACSAAIDSMARDAIRIDVFMAGDNYTCRGASAPLKL